MKHHQPAIPNHLQIIATFAAVLNLQPCVEDRPHDSALGSILGRFVCQSSSSSFKEFDYQTLSDVAECDAPIWNPSFTPPRRSSTQLRAIHLIHFERDLKVLRLEQRLRRMTTAAHVWWETPSCGVSPAALLPQFIHADVFVGKSVLYLCWQLCFRVPQLTRRIEMLSAKVAGLPRGSERNGVVEELRDTLLDKQIAYPCFQHRKAGLDAYQAALCNGRTVEDAIDAGLTAERTSIGPYNPARFTWDYLAIPFEESEVEKQRRKRLGKSENKDHSGYPSYKYRKTENGIEVGEVYQVCPAIDLPKQIIRFDQVTPEDVASGSKSAFRHSRNMPLLLTNFCPNCTERIVVNDEVVRTTRGLYLPKEHECSVERVCNAVPEREKQGVVVRESATRSEEAEQRHFESTLVTFVGDGGSLEAIEGFSHTPRAKYNDQRAEDLFEAGQSWKQVGIAVGPACIRCAAPITKRKGTKYCSDDCRKRDFQAHHNAEGDR